MPVVGHSLCGDLVKTLTYNNLPLDATNGPMKSFDSSNNKVTVESVDATLIDVTVPIDTYPYKIHAEFAAYPDTTHASVSVADATGVISFGNECLTPVFSETTQTSNIADSYTDSIQTFTLVPFTISPVNCNIEYSCVAV